jgi:hypothetical protein
MENQQRSDRWEDRPNWANCFPPKSQTAKADFVGVMRLNGEKYWVRLFKRLDKNGQRFVSVNLMPFDQEGAR